MSRSCPGNARAALTLTLLLAVPLAAIDDPTVVPDPFEEVHALLGDGRNLEAARLIEARLAEDATDATAWWLLGRARWRAGRLDGAYDALLRADRYGATAEHTRLDLARVTLSLFGVEESLRWIDRAWEGGFRDLDRLREDEALAALRDDSRFDRLVQRLENSLIPFCDQARVIHTFEGAAAGEQYGWVAVDLGDVDGDGVRDAAIGAPTATVDGTVRAGRVEVRSGRTGALLLELRGGTEDGLFGNALGAVGDIDHDGAADVIVGAPGLGERPGRVSVHSGRDGSLLHELDGSQPGCGYGAEARGAGDWDQDGTPDLLIGAPAFDGPAGEDAGRVWLLSGADLSPIRVFDGDAAGDRLGRAAFGSVADGEHLLVLGAARAGPERRGRAMLYRGTGLERLATIENDSEGVALGEMFVSVVGDVDADGTPDFSISDWRHRAWGPNTGRVVVCSGRDGSRLLTLTGKTGEGFGIGDGIVGDADGDGHDDLIVGAWLSSRHASGGGSAFLISGAHGDILFAWHGRTVDDHVGFDATGLGDVDGDGCLDYLVTAASSSVRGPDTGRVFILAGPPFLCSEPVQGRVNVVERVPVRGAGARRVKRLGW